jgi:hypothetical protein
MSSTEFRKRFASLTKLTVVTANGHTIGEWTPVGAGAPIAMHASDFEGGYAAERRQFREDAFLSVDEQTGLPAGLAHANALIDRIVGPIPASVRELAAEADARPNPYRSRDPIRDPMREFHPVPKPGQKKGK